MSTGFMIIIGMLILYATWISVLENIKPEYKPGKSNKTH